MRIPYKENNKYQGYGIKNTYINVQIHNIQNSRPIETQKQNIYTKYNKKIHPELNITTNIYKNKIGPNESGYTENKVKTDYHSIPYTKPTNTVR